MGLSETFRVGGIGLVSPPTVAHHWYRATRMGTAAGVKLAICLTFLYSS